MKTVPLLLFVLVIAAACSDENKVPKGILPLPKMREVMWDMISAGEFLNGYVLNKDSVDRFAEAAKVYGQVLQVHKITREQFDKSYLYYEQHPALMKVIVDSLSKRQIDPAEIYAPKAPAATDSTKKDSLHVVDSTVKMPAYLNARRDSIRKKIKKMKAIPLRDTE